MDDGNECIMEMNVVIRWDLPCEEHPSWRVRCEFHLEQRLFSGWPSQRRAPPPSVVRLSSPFLKITTSQTTRSMEQYTYYGDIMMMLTKMSITNNSQDIELWITFSKASRNLLSVQHNEKRLLKSCTVSMQRFARTLSNKRPRNRWQIPSYLEFFIGFCEPEEARFSEDGFSLLIADSFAAPGAAKRTPLRDWNNENNNNQFLFSVIYISVPCFIFS